MALLKKRMVRRLRLLCAAAFVFCVFAPTAVEVFEESPATIFGRNLQLPELEINTATQENLILMFWFYCPDALNYPIDQSSVILVGPEYTMCENDEVAERAQKVVCDRDVECLRHLLDRFGNNQTGNIDVLFCSSCPQHVGSTLRLFFNTVVNISSADFEQIVWLESLTMSELRDWAEVTFSISIISTCRLGSLLPLMESLQFSFFLGDRVDLHVSVDAAPSSECLRFLHAYQWPHGSYDIRRRIRATGGAQVAVPEGLSATGTTSHRGILLEDDVSISRQFYCWLKFVSLQLRSYEGALKQNIFSISLYTPRVIETGTQRREYIKYGASGIHDGSIFLYEVPCSWGSAFAAPYWSVALNYFEVGLLNGGVFDEIPKSRVNGWKGSWKRWLIEIGYHLHWTTVYAHFRNETSFSTNLLQRGQHITAAPGSDERKMYQVPIFEDNGWYRQLTSKRIFPVSDVRDLHFKPVRQP